ncbi:MAG: Hsp20/alpha crystallin family protein [Bryobacteraceae bacterium]
MATTTRQNPFTESDDFPTGLRLFQDTFNRMLSEPNTSRPWAPSVDIFETENELVLHADLPGVDMNDIDIKVENNTLAIKGERKFEQNEHHKGFHRIERSYGSFVRYFSLPDTVDTDSVKAAYSNGVLTITLPKKEMAKPKSIKVQVNGNK